MVGPFLGCLSSYLGQHKDNLQKALEYRLPGSRGQRAFSAEGSSGGWQCVFRKRGRFHVARRGVSGGEGPRGVATTALLMGVSLHPRLGSA